MGKKKNSKVFDDNNDALLYHLDFDMKLEECDKYNLPLYHLCTQDQLISYLKNKFILPSDQEETGFDDKDIVFTYYGASKFSKNETTSIVSKADYSTCIIIDSNNCGNILQMYPFDSGFIYGKHPKSRATIMDWERIKKRLNLGELIDRLNKVILLCFTDIESYIDGKLVVKDGKIVAKYTAPKLLTHISDLHRILKDDNIGDDRRHCFEVHFEDKFDLNPSSLINIIASIEILLEIAPIAEEFDIDLDKSLMYPSSEEVNNEIDKLIKRKTIIYSKDLYNANKMV